MLGLGVLAPSVSLQALGNVVAGRYRSDIFGIQFSIPAGWHPLLPATYIDLVRRLYGHDVEEVDLPLAMVTRLQEPTDVFNDSVAVFVDDHAESNPFSSLESLDWMSEHLVQTRQVFRVLLTPRADEVFGVPGAHFSYSCQDTALSGQVYDLHVDLHIVKRGRHSFLIKFERDSSRPDRSEAEFALAKNSLRFV